MTPEEEAYFAGLDRADGVTRREFLEGLSAAFAAASLAGCGKLRPAKEKIIPLADQPEGALPGLARWYATTCGGCEAACGALVKSRDGRPVKMEGNPDHPLSRGGLCARGQASVLDLYDSARLRAPLAAGAAVGWRELDAKVRSALAKAREKDRAVRVVSRSLVSPSERAALARFLAAHPGSKHVAYDPLSCEAILEAHRLTHGRRVLPRYFLRRAKAIVSFDADFLGTWISPVEYARDWAANRRPDGAEGMSWHAQFEPRLSLTGASADLRAAYRPSEELAAVAALARIVARKSSWTGPLPRPAGPHGLSAESLEEAGARLVAARGRALVVSGSSDPAVQATVNFINELLGAYGSTLDIARPSHRRQGDEAAFEALVRDLRAGQVGVLVVLDANPVYEHPLGEAFAQGMAKADTVVALCGRRDETADRAGLLAPLAHALESWGDAEPEAGELSLVQPLLSPIYDARPAIESLLAWSGSSQEAYAFVRERWRAEVFARQKEVHAFEPFWDAALRRGGVTLDAPSLPKAVFDPGALSSLKAGRRPAARGDFELVCYPSVALGDGRQANNPWLQELPDPVSKVTWGNYASFSPADARRLGLLEGRVVRLTAGGKSVELPAHVQPGLPDGVVAAALGYGRTHAGPIASNEPMVKMLPLERDLLAGADLYPLSRADAVSVSVGSGFSALAKTQTTDTLVDPLLKQERPFLRETTLAEFRRDERAGNPEEEEGPGLWPRHEYKGHKWAMAIDLNACTGCSACVVACQAENNVPVVGKAEVRKSRDMAWLRIDRYYAERPGGLDTAFQPMLCQHCDNAPCETVCPVLATVHSTEGLNMQVYNRCVGTRYCGNNCPYKVRRFNWFDYAHRDLVQNLSLNPDVTVRTRGVMEKCSFCVQRIYGAKGDSKVSGRELADGAVKTACQQSCPVEALIFGDLNDPSSRIAKLAKSPRGYRVLSELGVGPSVFYQTKVRNRSA